MKHIKLVDTVGTVGQAEEFILGADFERFIKDTYGRKELLSVDPDKIVKKYNLKGLIFGNYVTQEERYHFLYKIENQLEILAKIGGSNDLGKGVLVIAFGSQGSPRANAHFNAFENLINLARGRKSNKRYIDVLKGENSFIHEYGHFLDYQEGVKINLKPKKSRQEYYPTYHTQLNNSSKVIQALISVVSEVERNTKYMDNLKGFPHTKYLESRIEIWARLFETAITYYAYTKFPSKRVFLDVEKYNDPEYPVYLTKAQIKKGKYEKKVAEILSGKITASLFAGSVKDQKKDPQKKTASKKLIPIKKIVLDWSESLDLSYSGKVYKTFAALKKDLIKAHKEWQTENRPYSKTKIALTWEDGTELVDRIDLGRQVDGNYNPSKESLDSWFLVSSGGAMYKSTIKEGYRSNYSFTDTKLPGLKPKAKEKKIKSGGSKHIKTTQKTFGKQTKAQIKKLFPNATGVRTVGKDKVIKDKNNKTLATWHSQRNDNGIIVVFTEADYGKQTKLFDR